jgi:thiol-disulfide isomerase/thioredoxin
MKNQSSNSRFSLRRTVAFLGLLLLNAEAFQAPSPRRPTRLDYANTADPGTEKKSFVDRMRELVVQEPAKKALNKEKPRHVTEVLTLGEFSKVVGEETSRITAVRWYASWCRACKLVQPYYYRLNRSYPGVKYAEVPATKDNGALQAGLGVTTIPYAHIYHPSVGLVEELKLNKETQRDFDKILKSYVEGSCDLPEDVDPDSGLFEAPYERQS